MPYATAILVVTTLSATVATVSAQPPHPKAADKVSPAPPPIKYIEVAVPNGQRRLTAKQLTKLFVGSTVTEPGPPLGRRTSFYRDFRFYQVTGGGVAPTYASGLYRIHKKSQICMKFNTTDFSSGCFHVYINKDGRYYIQRNGIYSRYLIIKQHAEM